MVADEPEMIWLPSVEQHYIYNALGDVIDWGLPNVVGYLASVPDHGVLQVIAWRTWYVKVWWQQNVHPWCFVQAFYVEHFEHIHRHWAKYFAPGQGLIDRISFGIENGIGLLKAVGTTVITCKLVLHHC